MFPALVGMNRVESGYPHTSHMFPALVGMNRGVFMFDVVERDVPRTRGDEPLLNNLGQALFICSPHSWG